MPTQAMVKSSTKAWIIQSRTNFLRYSNDFTQDEWVKHNATIVAGQADPDLGTNASLVTATAANATVRQVVRYQGGTLNRVISLQIKRVTGTGDIQLTVDGVNYTTVVVTGSWARFEVTATAGAEVFVGLRIVTSGDAVDIYRAQIEDGDTATTYVENTVSATSLLQITDPDYPTNTTRGVVFMDGFFFVMTPAGEIFQSALQDGFNWSSLEFIQSQNESSYGKYIGKIQSYIVTLKEWVIEFFYNAANPVGSVLSPVQNMTIQMGCASADSVQEMMGNLIWVSQTKLGFGRSVVMLSGTTQPDRISTPGIDNILEQSNLERVYSWVAQTGSHTLYGLTLVDLEINLAYDFTSKRWGTLTVLEEIATGVVDNITSNGVVTTFDFDDLRESDVILISGVSGEFDGWWPIYDVDYEFSALSIPATGTAYTGAVAPMTQYRTRHFPIASSANVAGRQYMQGINDGKLYQFSQQAYSDDGVAIPAKIRTAEMMGQTTDKEFVGKIELIGEKVDSDAFLRWTNDNYETWTKYRSVDLRASRSQLRRCGDFRRRGIEILHLNAVPVVFREIEVM